MCFECHLENCEESEDGSFVNTIPWTQSAVMQIRAVFCTSESGSPNLSNSFLMLFMKVNLILMLPAKQRELVVSLQNIIPLSQSAFIKFRAVTCTSLSELPNAVINFLRLSLDVKRAQMLSEKMVRISNYQIAR